MYNNLIEYLNIITTKSEIIINKHIPEEYLDKMQDNLIQLGYYIKITDLITYTTIMALILLFITTILFITINVNPLSVPIITLAPYVVVILYIVYKMQKREDNINEELPEYILQLSALLNVGLAIESALNELSKTQDGYLNNEIKRSLIEMSLGKSFDESFTDLINRCQSNNVKQVFQIIINTKQTGGNLSEILEEIAMDLKDMQMLQKESRANIIMSIMFLLIAAIIATPFAFGTINIYTIFLSNVGRTNSLIDYIPMASLGYIIIHSIMVSFLIGDLLYSNSKKSVLLMFIVIPSSLGVYYISQIVIRTILAI
ncbi:MAG: type II secretion system F family protein [Methanosphaera stadtmanae]|nr:type II secretion system F family protein [Methanosphaera stadtmanae]